MQNTRECRFPGNFVWGAATAAYQVEGAAHEDGRGESIWDRFSNTPGKVRNGESGEIACDHYHRYREDVALMRELGLDAYRFSIAWPRILPMGRGAVNEKGLDFYDRLVDELLDSGIEPFVTLYHWDLPQALEDEGGWTNRATADAFAAYTHVVVRRLGDRVRHWITLNEPWVVAWPGYALGVLAPGRDGGEAAALQAIHVQLLAHGKGMEVIRGAAPEAQAGITLNLTPIYPASEAEDDVRSARYTDGRENRWFLDAVFTGHYPDDMLELWREHVPSIEGRDMDTISMPIDFLGINNYSRGVVRADPTGRNKLGLDVRPENAKFTDTGWEVYPDGIFDLLERVRREYGPRRIYITENGAAFPDVRSHDGQVHDPERVQYLEWYTDSIGRALEGGVPLAGYFVWSLLDNFEWAHGYWKRFGITYLEYSTLERVPKASFQWYRSFITRRKAAAKETQRVG
ncbi:MAG: GH1 family beta-glucosidase [Chloroflexota bacterium]|nr:MAG: beta-glucosidase [Chloroflexota bacterium]